MTKYRDVTTNLRPSGLFEDLPFPYTSKRTLLSPGERRFYETGLLPAFEGKYRIFAKVRLTDIVSVPKKHWNSTAGRKIKQRHVDFVLVTKKALAIKAVIELDDKSHDIKEQWLKDRHLDDVLYAAGIPIVRFPVYRIYKPMVIRSLFFRMLKGHRSKGRIPSITGSIHQQFNKTTFS